MKMLRLALVCVLAFGTSGAMAAPNATVTADASTNPVLASIQKLGAKFFYLGNRGGLDGWLIIKGGQMQIAYATPDNKGAVIGALFGQDGDNLTVAQINNLAITNKEVADLLASAGKEQTAINEAGQATTAVAPAQQAALATPNSTGMPTVPLSPGERLIHDLSIAAGVVLGNPASPEILMVMDPRCPHCQATWKALHDSVINSKLHLRMIPIGAQDSENERAAAILLSQDEPLTAWSKFVGGDATALAGTPSPAALAAVRGNLALITNWKIENTPYLVYRGKDLKVKIIKGEPEKLSALFNDLGL